MPVLLPLFVVVESASLDSLDVPAAAVVIIIVNGISPKRNFIFLILLVPFIWEIFEKAG